MKQVTYPNLHSNVSFLTVGALNIECWNLYTHPNMCVNCLGFPGGSAGEESACNAGDLGSGEGNGYPLQGSGLENGLYSPRGRKELDTTERLSRKYLYRGNCRCEWSSVKKKVNTASRWCELDLRVCPKWPWEPARVTPS